MARRLLTMQVTVTKFEINVAKCLRTRFASTMYLGPVFRRQLSWQAWAMCCPLLPVNDKHPEADQARQARGVVLFSLRTRALT